MGNCLTEVTEHHDQEDIAVVRARVLQGDFMDAAEESLGENVCVCGIGTRVPGGFTFTLKPKWAALSPNLEIFVSSTFTDTMAERNRLLNEILSILREEAAKHGLQVYNFSIQCYYLFID